MPCLGPDTEYTLSETDTKLRNRERMLCAVLTVFDQYEEEGEGSLFKMLKYNLSSKKAREEMGGLTYREVVQWWEAHKKEDLARKNREGIEEKAALARQRALKKLTKKERDLLGVD